MSTEIAERDPIPTLSEITDVIVGTEGVHPALVLPRLLAVSRARAEWLGRRLAEQVNAEGMVGMVGHTYAVDRFGDRHAVSEEVRALAELEARERATAARLAREIAQLGLDERHLAVRQAESVALVVEAFRAFCAELGVDFADPEIRRAAQRALLAARDARPQQVAGNGARP